MFVCIFGDRQTDKQHRSTISRSRCCERRLYNRCDHSRHHCFRGYHDSNRWCKDIAGKIRCLGSCSRLALILRTNNFFGQLGCVARLMPSCGVCPSVCHVRVLCRNEYTVYISSNFFSVDGYAEENRTVYLYASVKIIHR